MQITDELINYIAELSKLELDKTSAEKMRIAINDVVDYMEILNDLDTENVEPLTHVLNLTNVLRDDEVKPSLTREEILKNAANHTEEYFVVPKTVE